jgi:hypothetical protein
VRAGILAASAAVALAACSSAGSTDVRAGGLAAAARAPGGRDLSVLRVRELVGGRVRARVIHARVVHAEAGRVRRVLPASAAWRAEARESRVDAAEVAADVIYAESVRAEWLDAGEIHAAEVTVGGRSRAAPAVSAR